MCLFPGMQGDGSIAEPDKSRRSGSHGLGPKSATTTPLWDFASQGTPGRSGGCQAGIGGLTQILPGTRKTLT